MEQNKKIEQGIVRMSDEEFEKCLVHLFEYKGNPKLVESILIVRDKTKNKGEKTL